MPRAKGTPKTGGRKKGSPNKKDIVIKDFRDRLEDNKINFERELAKAIRKEKIETIRNLALLLPYLAPRLKEVVKKPPPPEPIPDDPEATAELLKLLRD